MLSNYSVAINCAKFCKEKVLSVKGYSRFIEKTFDDLIQILDNLEYSITKSDIINVNKFFKDPESMNKTGRNSVSTSVQLASIVNHPHIVVVVDKINWCDAAILLVVCLEPTALQTFFSIKKNKNLSIFYEIAEIFCPGITLLLNLNPYSTTDYNDIFIAAIGKTPKLFHRIIEPWFNYSPKVMLEYAILDHTYLRGISKFKIEHTNLLGNEKEFLKKVKIFSYTDQILLRNRTQQKIGSFLDRMCEFDIIFKYK